MIDNGSYDHVRDSVFKRDFLRIIQGKIEEKLETSNPKKRDENLDCQLLKQLLTRIETNTKYKQMQNSRERLPSFAKREEILKLLENNQVVLISGETGCGKTTQVAQFILDSYITQGKGSLCRIVCTQPRRISAVSVATRVAEERVEPLGLSVGYQIRLER